MIERFAGKVEWIIVAAWSGEGFKNQFKSIDNLIFPHEMCELEKLMILFLTNSYPAKASQK